MRPTIYTRMSLDKDLDSLGVTRQEEACRDYCTARGWDVREVFSDNDTSATSGVRRPGFEALLQSDPEAIVVWHTDRLVRLSRELERVIDLGVNVYAVQAGHLDLSTPAGRAVAKTVTAWAQYEGEQKGERQRAAFRQRAEQGKPWWSTRPFGFERDGTLREDEAELIRSAYRTILAGGSLYGVIADWNARGVKSTRGNRWGSTALRHLLLNARNAGIKVYDGEEIGPGNWEAIVSEAQWRSMVRLLNSPERDKGGRGTGKNLLSGLARCAKCGGPINQGRRRGDRYYFCRGDKCLMHDADWCDAMVRGAVVAKVSRPDWAKALAPEDEDASATMDELDELDRREQELMEDYAEAAITRQEFRSMKATLSERREVLRLKLAQAGVGAAVADLLTSDVAARWDTMTVHEQQATVRALFERVELVPRGRGNRKGLKPEHIRIWNDGEPLPDA